MMGFNNQKPPRLNRYYTKLRSYYLKENEDDDTLIFFSADDALGTEAEVTAPIFIFFSETLSNYKSTGLGRLVRWLHQRRA